MGMYATRSLPIYAYLHQDGHPHYAIVDSLFQAAFGGSRARHGPAACAWRTRSGWSVPVACWYQCRAWS
jgi:hypothetical protein